GVIGRLEAARIIPVEIAACRRCEDQRQRQRQCQRPPPEESDTATFPAFVLIWTVIVVQRRGIIYAALAGRLRLRRPHARAPPSRPGGGGGRCICRGTGAGAHRGQPGGIEDGSLLA